MYGFTTTLAGQTFDEAIVNTTAALKAEGFGILSDIDVQHAMKEKLGKEWAATDSPDTWNGNMCLGAIA